MFEWRIQRVGRAARYDEIMKLGTVGKRVEYPLSNIERTIVGLNVILAAVGKCLVQRTCRNKG